MSNFKSLAAKPILVVMLLCLAGVNALADFTFDIAGSTAGRFYLGSIPLGTSLSDLSFTGTSFRQIVAPRADIAVDLGSFSLATLLSYYDPFDLKLPINFAEPIAGGTLFHGDLSGLATIFGSSMRMKMRGTALFSLGRSAKAKFDNDPRHFSFTGPQGSGNLDLFVTDVKVTKVSNFPTVSIKGKITNIAANPEPATILLTSIFMSGVIVLFRKRLRKC